MTSVNLQQWIRHPEMLNRDTLYELGNLIARYPYFQTVRLLYLKNLYILHDINFGAELRKSILYVGDRRMLFRLIEGDRYKLHPRKKTGAQAEALTLEIMEAEPTIDRTLALIDAFLATVPEEVAGQTELDYSTDYTAFLLQDASVSDDVAEETPKLKGQDLIDGFLEKSENGSSLRIKPLEETDFVLANPADDEEATEEEDDSCFTETLAKIYVKQKRYSKALEIIKKLSLKYPKKNAYFADQIRFLEKLIINAKSK